jgi:hypothetical protein
MNRIVNEKNYISSKLGVPYESLSQSYLRAETTLASLSIYKFKVQQGQQPSPSPSEVLLNLNDQFVITHFFVGLQVFTTAGLTNTIRLNTPVDTYADPNRYLGDTANAAGIYNSTLQMAFNRVEYLPNFPVRSFLRVPVTQSGSFLKALGTPTTGSPNFLANQGVNSYENSMYGFAESEPIKIDGRETLDISLNLNNASDITDGTQTAVAVLELRGYLIVNAKS